MLNGCSLGGQLSYHDVEIKYVGQGTSKVGVATYDQRAYIKNGDKQSNFVGLARGGYGNSFDVTTVSGKSLAEDMTSALENSLSRQGFQVVPVIVSQDSSMKTAVSELSRAGGRRSILLVLNEWKSDTYQNTGLYYDVVLKVLNKSGKVLTEKTIKGKDNLGGSFWNQYSYVKQAVPKAFKEKIESLLNAREVVRALK